MISGAPPPPRRMSLYYKTVHSISMVWVVNFAIEEEEDGEMAGNNIFWILHINLFFAEWCPLVNRGWSLQKLLEHSNNSHLKAVRRSHSIPLAVQSPGRGHPLEMLLLWSCCYSTSSSSSPSSAISTWHRILSGHDQSGGCSSWNASSSRSWCHNFHLHPLIGTNLL